MNELVKKVDFFENLMLRFAQEKMKEAYDVFAKRHGYDLRKTNDNDHLEFCKWDIENDVLILSYKEVTQHDCPYEVQLEYKIDGLSINCDRNSLQNSFISRIL